MNIPLITYGIPAVGYLLLTAMLVIRWRGRPLAPAVIAASGSTALWAATIAYGTSLPEPPIAAIQLSEVAKHAGWIFLALQLLSLQSEGRRSVWLGKSWIPAYLTGTGAVIAIITLGNAPASLPIDSASVFDLVTILWIALSIIELLLVEQLYRNASVEERWGLKFLCLCVGVVAAYDLFMYGQTLLFRQLDAQLWQARGVVTAAVLPWLAVAIARNRNWRLELHVSRHVVFHTVTLLGAGVYLLGMAIVGYFIRYLGGNWGYVLQLGFLVAGGLLLLTLLFSGTLRSRLRVFLSKHFFSYRYDYRVEWLKFTEGLASLNNIPAGITRTMAGITSSPGGMLIHQGPQGGLSEFSSWGFDAPEGRPLGNLPEWLIESEWIIDLVEFRETPDLYKDLNIPEWLSNHESLWLVIPLLFQNKLEAILLLRRTDVKKSLNWEDRDLLKTAGRQAAALLAQDRASQALLEARQFDAFNRLSAYVIHDLKNILAQQSLMVSNARKHRENPAFVDDMISTIENSVNRMQRLMDQMRSGMRAPAPKNLDLESVLNHVIELNKARLPRPRLVVSDNAHVIADRDRLSTVFSHLVQNAQEATPDDGDVTVHLTKDGEHARVSICDTGSGMSDHFVRDQLFRPFASTKGLTGMGIGAFESRDYVRQLGGDITVTSQEGAGSTFDVLLLRATEL